jgi:hypothetical protein
MEPTGRRGEKAEGTTILPISPAGLLRSSLGPLVAAFPMEHSPPARAARAPTLPESKRKHDRFHSHDKDGCISLVECVMDHVENDYSGQGLSCSPNSDWFRPKTERRPTEIGKTHLSVALAEAAIRSGLGAYFITAHDLAADLWDEPIAKAA